MKITKIETLGIIAALLTVAGCAHRASYSSYDERISSPAYGGTSTTTYDNRSTTYNSSVRATTESPTSNNNIAVNQTYSAAAGQQKEMGTLEAGKLANIAFFTSNPLDDIGALRTIDVTVKRGARFPRKDYRPLTPDEVEGRL